MEQVIIVSHTKRFRSRHHEFLLFFFLGETWLSLSRWQNQVIDQKRKGRYRRDSYILNSDTEPNPGVRHLLLSIHARTANLRFQSNPPDMSISESWWEWRSFVRNRIM